MMEVCESTPYSYFLLLVVLITRFTSLATSRCSEMSASTFILSHKQIQDFVKGLLSILRHFNYVNLSHIRCGSRIWSRGGPQLLRPKVADIAKRSRASEASILWPGSRARLRALEAFGFLMLKYAFSHILETLFLLFLTSILTPKVDKNRALDFTSINLRHSDMLHLFFNLHEKVML